MFGAVSTQGAPMSPDDHLTAQRAELQRAIDLVGAGAIARRCGVASQSVYKWRTCGVPIERAPGIELATGGQVTCDAVCPDVTWHRDARGAVVAYTVPIQALWPRAVA